jgi:glycosyltransferase involved in cell wall biosynthesis
LKREAWSNLLCEGLFLSSKSKPLVTIGVCARNCEDTIGEAVETISSQDFSHELMEVIFVDDGSEDGTLSTILDCVSRMDMQVRVHHQGWRGMGPTRNMVVDNAKGDYIVWVDADTILSRDYVRRQVGFMEKNPTVGIARGKCGNYGDLRPHEDQSLVAFLEFVAYAAVDIKYGGKQTQKLLGTAGSTYRLKAIKQVGGFDDRITGAGEDMDVAYRIRENGWLIYRAIEGVFYTKQKETWKGLWSRYFWHGYGSHYVHHKQRGIGKLYDMVPLAAFLSGLLYALVAYRLTHRKKVFLLPLHFVFKITAWWMGFIKSHLNSYGHIHGHE